MTLIISLFFVNCRLMSIEMALARESFLEDRTFRPLASLILGHSWVPIGDSKLWPDCLGCSFSCYHAALAERSINIRVSSGHLIGLTVGFFSIPPVSRYVIIWWLIFQSVTYLLFTWLMVLPVKIAETVGAVPKLTCFFSYKNCYSF